MVDKDHFDGLEYLNPNDIAVVGMSGAFPGAADIDAFAANLQGGAEFVGAMPTTRRTFSSLGFDRQFVPYGYLERVDLFDYRFFGLSLRDAELMDPQQRFLLQHTYLALQDAACRAEDLAGTNTAVVVSARYSDYFLLLPKHLVRGATVGNIAAMAAGRIAYHLDLRGPSIIVDTACSSSLFALHNARQMLARGDVSQCIVGAVNIVNQPLVAETIEDIGVVSPDGHCRPFDAKANGTVGGEGGAVLVLKRLTDALRNNDHVHAVIKGSAANHDGARSSGLTVPSHAAQTEAIAEAWRQAGGRPSAVTYLEAHGTGTKIGDPVELRGLRAALIHHENAEFRIASVKANIGHLDAAAGIAGTVRAILALKSRRLFPLANFRSPNPLASGLGATIAIQSELSDWPAGDSPRRVGVSSFSLNGTNVHLVLEEAQSPILSEALRFPCTLKLSAFNQDALRSYAESIELWIRNNGCSENLLFTLNTGRSDFPYRMALNANSAHDLARQLQAVSTQTVEAVPERKVVLLLGQVSESKTDAACRSDWFLSSSFGGVVLTEFTPNQRALLCQAALHGSLVALGVPVDVVIGSQVGSIAKRLVTGDYDLVRALAEALTLKPTTPDSRKFAQLAVELKRKNGVFVALTRSDSLACQLLEADHSCDLFTHDNHGSPLALAGNLYRAGVGVDWHRFHQQRASGFQTPCRIKAPTLQFQPVRCWFADPVAPPTSGVAVASPSDVVTGTAVVRTTGWRSPQLWTDLQGRLGGLWWAALKPDTLELDDIFFDIGGHSIAALELVDAIEPEFGVGLTIEEFYSNPSIRTQAALLGQRLADSSSSPSFRLPLERSSERGPFPLSHAQHRLWVAAQLDRTQTIYNLPHACIIRGEFSAPKVRHAVELLTVHHEALRTIIVRSGTEPEQHVRDELVLDFVVKDLRGAEKPTEEARAHVLAACCQPFQLDRLPLFRVLACRLNDDTTILALVIHHIISDGWSMKILLRDLSRYYAQLHAGGTPEVAQAGPTYRDYARWHNQLLNSNRIEIDRRYWQEVLSGFTPKPLGLRRRDLVPVATEQHHTFAFGPLTDAIRQLAGAEQVTVFTVLLAGFFMAICESEVSEDICIGIDMAGRTHPELRQVVGMFVNTLPIRNRVNADDSFRSLLRATKQRLLDAQEHQAYPFDYVLRDIRTAANAAQNLDLFDAFVSYQNPTDFRSEVAELERVNWRVEPYEVHPPGSRFNLELMLIDTNEEIVGAAYFGTALFRKSTVELFVIRYLRLLQNAIATPDASLSAAFEQQTTNTVGPRTREVEQF